jgi:tripartite-type tricarboxylate transporter receptor subunit TctC
MVVPWPAGGTGDTVTRIVTHELEQHLGQTIVVENRPGANGTIGANVVAKAPPDGYTLVFSNAEVFSIGPSVYTNVPYDAVNDFVPVAPMAKIVHALASRTNLTANSVGELIALAKAQPGNLTYGSWSIGSPAHIGMEMLDGQAAVSMLHVPYNGGPPAFNAIMGGQIDLLILPVGNAAEMRKGGKIKILAVTTSNRIDLMPEVPTLKEQGYDVEIVNHFGFMAPAKTPAKIVQKLNTEISAVLQMPSVRAALKAQGAEPFILSPEDYATFLGAERKRWGDAARRAKITIDLK